MSGSEGLSSVEVFRSCAPLMRVLMARRKAIARARATSRSPFSGSPTGVVVDFAANERRRRRVLPAAGRLDEQTHLAHD